MTAYEIPLSPEPQSFYIQLAGVQRLLRLYWNINAWALDISDPSGAALLSGIPLITGVDLLAQHHHLELGGSLVVQSDFDPDAVPTFDNLGVQGRLYFLVE